MKLSVIPFWMDHLKKLSVACIKRQWTLLLIVLGSCTHQSKPTANQVAHSLQNMQTFSNGYELVSHTKLDSLVLNIGQISGAYFADLHPITTEIQPLSSERSVLVDALKSKGFSVENVSWGNWEHGPRMVHYEMQKDSCNCRIEKFYATLQEAKSFQVFERIRCIQKPFTHAKIDAIAKQTDQQVASKALSKYFHPNMSSCGGAVYGYYRDSTLVFTDSHYGAELGYTSCQIYWDNQTMLKLIYRVYAPDYETYDINYPAEKFGWDTSKMKYLDTTYLFTLGLDTTLTKNNQKQNLSLEANKALLNRLLDCGHQMKNELESERKLITY